MEEFIENIKMMVNTLGHKVFEEKREFKAKRKQESFFIKAVRGADGQGDPTSEGFLVLKGSKAAGMITPSFSASLSQLREKLIDEGILKTKDEYLEFVEDNIFSSPSTAAAIVMGRAANGLIEWKKKDGTTLKDFESNKSLSAPLKN